MPRAKKSAPRKTATAKKRASAARRRTTQKSPSARRTGKTTAKSAVKRKTSSKSSVRKPSSQAKSSRTAKKKTAAKKSTRNTAGKQQSRQTATIIEFPTKPIPEKQTKSEIIRDVAAVTNIDRKHVKSVLEALKNHIARHMKSRGSGEMTIPELGIKVRRVKRPATKRRKGRNPFTGEEIMIAAKPARTAVKAVALKLLKELA